ncbi:MAG: putative glycoside hydrolase [Acidimicrobiales bacterium]
MARTGMSHQEPARSKSPRRRRFWPTVLVLAALLSAALVEDLGSDFATSLQRAEAPTTAPPADQAGEPARPEPSVLGVPFENPTPAPGGGAVSAYAPQPHRGFQWIGANRDGEQFSDEEIATLARDNNVVVLAKFHARWNIEAHHEDARRLVAARPDIRVFPYFSTKYWFEKNNWGVQVPDEFLLRDRNGDLVPRVRPREDRQTAVASYVDLANPEYRAWALDVMASWLQAAPYAGVAFDAAVPIGLGDERNQAEWNELLGLERVAAYNAGMRELLAATERLVGPDRTVLYNGISPNTHLKGPDRNTGLLDVAGAALDERFCLDVHGETHYIEDDIALLSENRTDELFMRVSFRPGTDMSQRPRLERFCFGVFMLGWQPGYSYLQIGTDFSTNQLRELTDDLYVNLGNPLGPYQRRGDVAERQFEHGMVYVNLGPSPTAVDRPATLAEVDGGRVVADAGAGGSIELAPNDATILLDPALAGTG